MTEAALNIASTGPATRFTQEKLAAQSESLAILRFSIILTARWASSETETRERRQELRAELGQLRSAYFAKIDEIAMTFGVQAAMDAQHTVEQTVKIPRDAELSRPAHDGEQVGFGWQDAGESI